MLRKTILILLLSFASFAQAATVFKDNQNHLIDTKTLKGKWIIVNYWAEWCGPCVKEIPELNNFYKTNKNANVVLYGVYYDEVDFDSLKRVVKEAGIKFPVLAEDPMREWQLSDVEILPTTFIINPKGEVAKTIYGASSELRLRNILQELQASYAEKK